MKYYFLFQLQKWPKILPADFYSSKSSDICFKVAPTPSFWPFFHAGELAELEHTLLPAIGQVVYAEPSPSYLK